MQRETTTVAVEVPVLTPAEALDILSKLIESASVDGSTRRALLGAIEAIRLLAQPLTHH
jgi:hypothetical protein